MKTTARTLGQAALPDQTRREFFSQGCRIASVAALGAAVGALLESCTATSPSGNLQALPRLQAAESNGAISLTLDAGSPLAVVGGAALVRSSTGSQVLVARTGPDTFAALTAMCTHQACTVADIAGDTFVCPCHGSEFSFDGKVVVGPASLPLRRYNAQFANGVLTITA